MANKPNLKINIGADTSQFTKGVKDVKSNMRDLDRVGRDALNSLGNAVGVNTGKLSQISGALSGLGTKLGAAGTGGVASLGKIAAAAAGAATAVAGIGIAAASITFKALISEADAFKKTVEGAKIDLMTTAYIDTYKQALHDLNQDTAKAVAETQSKWKIFWGTLGPSIKEYFRSGQFGINLLQNEGATLPADIDTEVYSKNLRKIDERATIVAEITSEIYDIQRKLSDETARTAQLDAEIAKYKEIAYNTTNSTTEQAAAITRAEELIREKYDGENGIVALNKRWAELMYEANKQAGSTPEQVDAANQQMAKALNLEKAESDELRALSRRRSAILGTLEKETALQQKQLELAQRAAAAMKTPLPALGTKGLNLPDRVTSDSKPTGLVPVQMQVSNWDGFFKDVDDGIFKKFPNGIEIGVSFDYQTGLVDLTNAVESTISSLAESLGETVGQLLGDLATNGEDAWNNFGNNMLSMLGDMAQSVGKIAIATGVTVLGIQAALAAGLESPAPAIALIAAGTALVALGAAVKTSMANIAQGNYSATSSNIASSSVSSSNNSSYEEREIHVDVSGRLYADGGQLIAAIDATNNKNNHTT